MEEVVKAVRSGSEVDFDAIRLVVHPATALVRYGGSYASLWWLEKFSLDSNSSLPKD